MWSLAAFFAWLMIANLLWPPQPPAAPAVTATQPAAEPADSLGEAPPETASAETPAKGEAPSTRPGLDGFAVQGSETPETVILGTIEGGPESPFRMEVELTSLGASVRSVTLSDFAAEVRGTERYRLLDPVPTLDADEHTSFSIERVTVDGREIPVAEVCWQVAPPADPVADLATARFELPVLDGEDRHLLTLVREYRLAAQAAEEQRYDLDMSILVENHDQAPHQVVVTLLGPIGVHQEDPRTDYRAASVGTGEPGSVNTRHEEFRTLRGSERRVLYGSGSDEPLVWAAADNKFFTCTVAAVNGGDAGQTADFIAAANAVDLGAADASADGVTVQLATAARMVSPGGRERLGLACYLGPKDRRILQDEENHPDYVARGYYKQITRTYTWCTFGWLTEFMIKLLNGLYRVIPNYGVAIIILVLIVRTLLHPVTKAGQVNMMKMQKQMGKLTPKMEELKKKYANDKARMNQEIQKLYQSEGINPAGQMLTCLPMAIQMPIWVALWTSLNNNIAMRHEPFVLWIHDLTAADALLRFEGSYHVPLLGSMIGPVTALNIVPILLGVSMYVQQKLMPKPKPPQGQTSAQADQAAMMQKMMPLMSVFFALILYNAPSGLTVYIMASTLFGTIEQIRIRKHIKEVEARGGLEPGAAPVAGKDKRGPRGPLWLQRMRHQAGERWSQLQRQAEEAQRLRGKK